MKKRVGCFIFICLLLSATIYSSDLQDKLIETSQTLLNKEINAPNPVALRPQWWKYFEVEGDELVHRIQTALYTLASINSSLSGEEQKNAENRISMIQSNLYAYATAKKQNVKLEVPEHPFLKSYSLDQQLDILHKIRNLSIGIKNEEDELSRIKTNSRKAEKYIDGQMVNYLAMGKPSLEKGILGLDIIARRSALAVIEENSLLLKNRLEMHKGMLAKLQQELEYSKGLLNLSSYDEAQFRNEITFLKEEFESAQLALGVSEMNVFDVLHDTPYDRSMRHYLDESILYAKAYQDLAWANLAFLSLKFNLYMQVNNRFQESSQLLRHEQESWRDKVSNINSEIKEWRAATLAEQERVRQELGMLMAQNENPDRSLLHLLENRREETANTLTALQLLEEKLVDVQWLIGLLDLDISTKSSLFERIWMSIQSFNEKTWNLLSAFGNFSLFKVSGIPITFFMLLEVTIILISAFLISKLSRAFILPLVKNTECSYSTLYLIGRAIHYTILLLGTLMALVSIGMDSSSLFLLAGALVFGIGFGFQSIANNIFCGLRILFERKIKIGDYLELESGSTGKVSDIQLQHTVVTTSDGVDIIVPNSELTDKTVINWTMNNDFCRLRIPFATATDVDKDLVRRLVAQSALRVPCTIYDNPHFRNPEVWLVKFADNALSFELVVWVNLRVKSASDSREADYMWEIESALRENRIPLPVQSQQLYLQHPKMLEERIHQQQLADVI